ncbi:MULTISPECIES: hypothetical protein [Streptomyces]|uniref:Uncharacterized protein n=1 Tax=Streptomyces venezuelae TaxID=54571 RepID=A0A5P2AQA6_STRVZ|nr:hypothetical protein [Streptomyces venezuelae]QES18469.1 hypothetical protein DEJ46_04630 [Streptomyces venezuelae]
MNVVGIAGAGGPAFLDEFLTPAGARHLRRFGITGPGTYVLLDEAGGVAVRGADLDGRLAKEAASLVEGLRKR